DHCRRRCRLLQRPILGTAHVQCRHGSGVRSFLLEVSRALVTISSKPPETLPKIASSCRFVRSVGCHDGRWRGALACATTGQAALGGNLPRPFGCDGLASVGGSRWS